MGEHTATPGPWTALFHHPQRMGGREYVMITAGALVPLAAVVLGAEGCSHDEGRANARVIAALPDLVKALEEMVAEFGTRDDCDCGSCQIVGRAREALAKVSA